MVRIKKGAYGARLGREMAIWCMMSVCKDALEEAGFDYEISSGIEGEHMAGSLHYIGNACDWAVRGHIHTEEGDSLAVRCSDFLGQDFDVIWNQEKKVLHSEWQPKTSFGKLG